MPSFDETAGGLFIAREKVICDIFYLSEGLERGGEIGREARD
jgi:hypothetical protein